MSLQSAIFIGRSSYDIFIKHCEVKNVKEMVHNKIHDMHLKKINRMSFNLLSSFDVCLQIVRCHY